MVEKILNNTTPYGKIRASHEGSLHSSTLRIRRFNKESMTVFFLFFWGVGGGGGGPLGGRPPRIRA